MNKNIITIIIISLIILSTTFIGCMDTSSNDNQNDKPVIIKGKGGFLSIQNAINAAENSDTILIKKGIYYENLIINKSLKLIGEDVINTIITYNESINGENKTELIYISSNNCTIENLTFSLNKSMDVKSLIGIKITGSYNIIINNNISYLLQGIKIENGKNNTIYNNFFLENNQYSMYLTQSPNNKLLSNIIQSTKNYGMYISSRSDNNIMKDNVFIDNGYGIRLKGVSRNEVIANRIFNSSQIGLYFCCGANKNIAYNNSLEENFQNANDAYSNIWSYNGYGNYWDDYIDKYPNAEQNEGIWNIPYEVIGGNLDEFPLVESIFN